MKVAKAKGRLRGKQPKLNRRQEAHLVSLVHSGEYSTAEVAELFGVGRSTVYRAIERQLEHRAMPDFTSRRLLGWDRNASRKPNEVRRIQAVNATGAVRSVRSAS